MLLKKYHGIFFLFAFLQVFSRIDAAYYLEPSGGISFLPSTKYKLEIPLGNAGSSPRLKSRAKFQPGWNLGAAIGYEFSCYRVEVDYAHIYNEVFRIKTELNVEQGQAYYLYSGYVQAYKVMLNGFYKFTNCCPFSPYLGGGVGYIRLFSQQILNNNFFNGKTVDDFANCFGYNVKFGFQYDINPCFGTDCYYALLQCVNPRFHDIFGNQFHLRYLLHSLNFGIIYRF